MRWKLGLRGKIGAIVVVLIDTLNQFILYFVLYMSFESILEYIQKVMMVTCNSTLRVVEELSFTLYAWEWVRMSLLFLVYYMVLSLWNYVCFYSRSRFCVARVRRYIASFIVFVFLISVHILSWIWEISLTGYHPYESEVNILIGMLCPWIYRVIIGMFMGETRQNGGE